MDESGKDVVRILPHGLGNDDRRVGRDAGKGIHALALVRQESVATFGIDWMGALQRDAEPLHRLTQLGFQRLLCRPADLVGAFAQVAAGEQVNGLIGHFVLLA